MLLRPRRSCNFLIHWTNSLPCRRCPCIEETRKFSHQITAPWPLSASIATSVAVSSPHHSLRGGQEPGALGFIEQRGLVRNISVFVISVVGESGSWGSGRLGCGLLCYCRWRHYAIWLMRGPCWNVLRLTHSHLIRLSLECQAFPLVDLTEVVVVWPLVCTMNLEKHSWKYHWYPRPLEKVNIRAESV